MRRREEAVAVADHVPGSRVAVPEIEGGKDNEQQHCHDNENDDERAEVLPFLFHTVKNSGFLLT